MYRCTQAANGYIYAGGRCICRRVKQSTPRLDNHALFAGTKILLSLFQRWGGDEDCSRSFSMPFSMLALEEDCVEERGRLRIASCEASTSSRRTSESEILRGESSGSRSSMNFEGISCMLPLLDEMEDRWFGMV